MKKRIIILLFALLTSLCLISCGTDSAKAEPEPELTVSLAEHFTGQSYRGTEGELPYWLYIPENVTEKMPLVVVLHCSYMKAEASLSVEENLDKMTDPAEKDITSYIYNGEFGKVPAYIVMPQTTAGSRGWAKIGGDLAGLVRELGESLDIDMERVSLAGYSMGGTGALEVASAYPEIFDRVLAVAGGLDGVTNNNIPYIRGEGRMKLSEEFFPELRISTKKDPSVYEPEKMKYAYAPEDSSALTLTSDEKEAAVEFEAKRIGETAQKLKDAGISLWMLIGAKDTEVSPSVSKGIYDILGDRVRCDIIAECGHSGILNTCLEMNVEITEFLTN